MKTIKMFSCMFAVLLFAACSNSTEKTETEETTPPSTTIEKTTTIHTETNTGAKQNPDHTEIGVDENGVSYSKKKGSTETQVKIKTDSTSLRIRK